MSTQHDNLMQVSVRLPAELLYEGSVRKIFAVAENGAFGVWPLHTDYVSSLVPSVMVVTNEQEQELFFGIDHGLLVKRGNQVDIVVRRGVMGDDLAALTQTIESNFKSVDEQERVARTALSRLEVNIVRQLSQLSGPAP